MIIKNVSINIKTGNKSYIVKNLILDTYLEKFAERLVPENYKSNVSLRSCLLKLDTNLTFDETSVFLNEEFDIQTLRITAGQEQVDNLYPNKSVITQKYSFQDLIINTTSPYTNNNPLSYYAGHKITAIGFNTFLPNSELYKVCAIVDVSSFNIYIEPNSDLVITRTDTVETEAIFWSNSDLIKGPVHLASLGMAPVLLETVSSVTRNAYAKLTDLGFGYSPQDLYEAVEPNLTQDGTSTEIGQLTYEQSAYDGIYPSSQTFPSSTLFSSKPTYKYYILRFKIYQEVGLYYDEAEEEIVTEERDTGLYYHQAIPINADTSKTAPPVVKTITIKYERG